MTNILCLSPFLSDDAGDLCSHTAIGTTGLGTILLATNRAASRSSSKGARGVLDKMQNPAVLQ